MDMAEFGCWLNGIAALTPPQRRQAWQTLALSEASDCDDSETGLPWGVDPATGGLTVKPDQPPVFTPTPVAQPLMTLTNAGPVNPSSLTSVSAYPEAALPPTANCTSSQPIPASANAERTAAAPCWRPLTPSVRPNRWIPIPMIATLPFTTAAHPHQPAGETRTC